MNRAYAECVDSTYRKELRQEVMRISRDNPFVAAAVKAWQNDHVSWEVAMMQAVVCIATSSRAINEAAMRVIAGDTPPVVLQVSQSEFDSAKSLFDVE